jgi:hypothetical protein
MKKVMMVNKCYSTAVVTKQPSYDQKSQNVYFYFTSHYCPILWKTSDMVIFRGSTKNKVKYSRFYHQLITTLKLSALTSRLKNTPATEQLAGSATMCLRHFLHVIIEFLNIEGLRCCQLFNFSILI